MKKVIIGQNPNYNRDRIEDPAEDAQWNTKKNKRWNAKKTATGWVPETFDWDERTMARVFSTTGTNMSILEGGRRKDIDVIQMNGMMLDFDDGDMVEDSLVEIQEELGYASYAFGSINHKIHREKLRLYIPFDKPLKDINAHLSLESLILGTYAGDIDNTCLLQSRFFYHGNTGIFSSFVDGKFFDWETYLEENEPQIEAVDADKMNKVPKKNVCYYRGSDEVVLRSGATCAIKDLDLKTAYKNSISLVCPVCGFDEDRGSPGEPNALLGYSRVLLKDPKGKVKLDDRDKPRYKVDKNKIILNCFSCEDRGEGTGGKGIYNLHPDDIYLQQAIKDEEFAFVGSNTQDYHTIGLYRGNKNLQVKSPKKGLPIVRNFLMQRSMIIPKSYPEMELELDFGKKKRFDFEEGYVNRYYESEYLKKEPPLGHIAQVPKYIGLCIDHALGHDQEVKERFYNNMGYLIQVRRKLISTFLFQGVQGTGKGITYDILKEIIGSDFCVSSDQGTFNKEFNKMLENNLLGMINEVNVDLTKKDAVSARIKVAIAEHEPEIEGKGGDREKGKNVCTLLMSSNVMHAVTIEATDRRFNVAPRQEVAIHDTEWWLGDYETKLKPVLLDELQEFTWFLKQYKFDAEATKVGLNNEPKRIIQALSKTNQQYFIDAIRYGDMGWFHTNLTKKSGDYLDEAFSSAQNALGNLSVLTQKETGNSRVAPGDLLKLYNYIYSKNMVLDQFIAMCESHSLLVSRVMINGRRDQGFLVKWV